MIHVANNLELVPLEKLLPYEKNSRTHSEEQIAQIAESIKTFGFTNPILVDGADGIIAGHGRLAAAKKLKLKTVPVIQLGHLTPQQKRAYIIADNKLAENAGWDAAVLRDELAELAFDDDLGFDLSVIGFSDEELEGLLKFDGPPPGSGKDGTGKGTGEGAGSAAAENLYTTKIQAPVYEPKGERPSVLELCDMSKTSELKAEIAAAQLPGEIEAFLLKAAERHTVFDYEKIAEFYAHASPAIQELMENSALVIIDFQKAIEKGFVALTKEMAEAYPTRDDDES